MLKIEDNISEFSVEYLKVGVISDSQLTPCAWKKNTIYERNLIDSLQTFKSNECNMIIFAGDICNKASDIAYQRYVNCFKYVFGEDMPIVQSIMGNHDYLGFASKKFYRKLFRDNLNQEPFTHLVINGYHFIGVSPCSANMYDAYRPVEDWLERNINIALADNKDRPIFITTHNAPKDTVYGSDKWGDVYLGEILKKYKQVVNFCGHSHYSILDERSFYFDKYTVLSTQSVSYLEMESGKQNGTIPPMAFDCPMGYIMDFDNDKIFAKRYDLKRNIELKADTRWQIYPQNKRIINKENKPKLNIKDVSYTLINDLTQIKFIKTADSDSIHSYKLVINDNVEQYYFSDFYRGIDCTQHQEITLYDLERGWYDIKIFAVNSYGQVSDYFVAIDNVPIIKKAKYRMIQTPEKLWHRF